MAFAARMDEQPEQLAPEARLLCLARSGDLDAFEQIVALHERRIFALALRLTGSVEDAKDATQETFIRLHRKIHQIDSRRSAGPWLYTVAVNACRDIGRERQRARMVPVDIGLVEPGANPEGLYSDQEREDRFRAALSRLPEKERSALLLREMEGLSTGEVARILGSSEATVRSQVCNARLKLRKLFGRRSVGKL
ncbi:MAG: RNA polymerase sigma factor [Bryobacteraceae bacterium]|jgi:RNA polymerase sigma-70 factor (ECF subfamily)